MKFDLTKVTAEMTETLRRSGSNDYEIAVAAQREVAKAFADPLRQGVLNGDILGSVYTNIKFNPGQSIEFPIDFLSPGSVADFVAYTMPNTGRIAERHVEGDYVMVRTFDVGASIDTHLKYLRDARWDVMGRMMQVLEAMFVRKGNNDGWRTILAAAVGRGLTVTNSQATQGLFTKRLVALMETVMTRQAGGNSTSLNRGQLTDLFISPESHQDVLSWDLTQVPDQIRTQIYTNWENGGVSKIGRVSLHDLLELGVAQDYQNYVVTTLSNALPASTDEFCVGLDLANRDSFVQPVRQEVEIFEDPSFHRQRRAGMYGFAEHGFAVLDSRRVLLGAL